MIGTADLYSTPWPGQGDPGGARDPGGQGSLARGAQGAPNKGTNLSFDLKNETKNDRLAENCQIFAFFVKQPKASTCLNGGVIAPQMLVEKFGAPGPWAWVPWAHRP